MSESRTMVRDETLEERLQAWAKEYGGSKYEHIGYARKNALQTLMDHQGEPPESGGYRRTLIGTLADEVEEAVQLLLRNKESYKAAHILRIDYFRPDLPICEKRKSLQRMGVSVSESYYYQGRMLARLAVRVYLAGIKRLERTCSIRNAAEWNSLTMIS